MNSHPADTNGIESRSTFEQKKKIEDDREPVPENVVDILKKKSSIVGVKDNTEKLKFSSHIQKAYIEILEPFNGRTKVIMEIVASVPDVKIIFLPNEDNIHKYEQDEEPEFILEGITYAKSESIIIAAKGYDKQGTKCYRKFLGVIIHEFCHFAVHETFGNEFKPYYVNDIVAAGKWNELINQYNSICLDDFPLIDDLFNNYYEDKWIDELVVRYPQFYVEHHEDKDYLQEFEETFSELHSIFIKTVHKEFKSEKEKLSSLRYVNGKSVLKNYKSKFNVEVLRKHVKHSRTKFLREMFDIGQTIYKGDETLEFVLKVTELANLNLKNYDTSAEILEKALKIESNSELITSLNILSLNLLGNVLFNKNHYSEAYKKFDEIEQLSFELTLNIQIKSMLNKTACSYKMGKYNDSLKLIENVLELCPQSTYAKELKAKAYSLKGFVLSESRNDFEAMKNFQTAYVLSNGKKKLDEKNFNLINQACSYFVLKNHEKSVKLLEIALKTKSTTKTSELLHIKSLCLWGDNLCIQTNFSAAIEKYENAARFCTDEMNDEKKEFLYNAASCHRSLNNYDKAIELVDTAMKIESVTETANKQNARSMNLWGCILYNQKNYLAAIEKHENAARFCTDEMNDEKKDYLYNAAECHRDLKNYDKSIEVIKKALNIESDTEKANKQNARFMNLWGLILNDQKNYSAEIEKHENAARFCTDEMNDEKKEFLYNAASCHRSLKNYDKAIELINAALKIESGTETANEQNARSMVLWGLILHFNQSNYSAAIEKFENAARLCTDAMNDDKKKLYLNNVASCHRSLKKYDKAIELVEAALKIESDTEIANEKNARSMNLWGTILYDQKNYSAAIEKHENAVRLCTDEMNDEKKLYLYSAAECQRKLKNC